MFGKDAYIAQGNKCDGKAGPWLGGYVARGAGSLPGPIPNLLRYYCLALM